MSNPLLERWEQTYCEIAPAGCYIALWLGFYAPEEELNTFPAAWIEEYTVRGLALDDPLMRWAYGNEGVIRWSELAPLDPANVLRSYAAHGLTFGAVACIPGESEHPMRSIGFFARSDREFTDEEMQKLHDELLADHNSMKVEGNLTPAQIDALRLLASGMRQKEIAYELGISQSAVKARLKGSIRKMGAKTAAQAASIASRKGLL